MGKSIRNFSQKIIMVIDDDPMFRDLFGEVFPEHRIFPFADGMEALKWLKENPKILIDLVISDYNMPGMNGIETCRQIRNIVPHVKSLLMSATIIGTLDCFASKNQFDGYFAKPFTITEVRKIVKRILTESKPFASKKLFSKRR